MSWKTIADGSYLYRKIDGVNRSLGPRSAETELAYERFQAGRARQRNRVEGLAKRLDEMAPVNRALGIGRMPAVSAKILRLLDSAGLLGKAINVVGTNALYAYEQMAGVLADSGLIATGDVDLLLDSRTRLKIAAEGDVHSEGLLGLLKKADRSFESTGRKSYRAQNRDGFMVDLVKPAPKNRPSAAGRNSLGGYDDLHAFEIDGLAWLVNSPKHNAVVIDERGYPLDMSVPDPRAFALHKAWLAAREDREPIKRQRDAGQAKLVASMVVEKLSNLKFDGADLSALPIAMRQAAETIIPPVAETDEEGSLRLEPKW